MPSGFLEVTPRNFNAMSVPGLTQEAGDGVNAALKAMSTWRNEIADTNEKNGKRVIEKMAAAAAAVGWPEQVVDAARTQLQSIAEIQIKTMDQPMDAWEEQIKLPNPMTASPSAMLSKLKSLPGLASAGSGPSAEDFQKAATNPFTTLDATCGTVAANMGRYHGSLGQAPLSFPGHSCLRAPTRYMPLAVVQGAGLSQREFLAGARTQESSCGLRSYEN